MTLEPLPQAPAGMAPPLNVLITCTNAVALVKVQCVIAPLVTFTAANVLPLSQIALTKAHPSWPLFGVVSAIGPALPGAR